MDNNGIIAQYGFLYQRLVFIQILLERMGANCNFIFEGKDDVDVLPDNKIYSITDYSEIFIQVKSGNITKDVFYKVLGNWLLLDSQAKYILYLENENDFNVYDEHIKDGVFYYIEGGKSKKSTSIARKVFNKYLSKEKILDEQLLRSNIDEILSKIDIQVIDIEKLKNKLSSRFYDDYCMDLFEYSIVKEKRFERFEDKINRQIDISISEKKPCCITYPMFMRIITSVTSEVNENSYTIDIDKYQKKFNKKAINIVKERVLREVRQLFLVKQDNAFVIRGIVSELFYKDFRDVFIDKKSVDISNLETLAKMNYEDARDELAEGFSPMDVYKATTDKDIKSSLLPAGSLYEKGCYIYLTSDEIEKQKQITWSEVDEIIGSL